MAFPGVWAAAGADIMGNDIARHVIADFTKFEKRENGGRGILRLPSGSDRVRV
jgi:hypothetical protein